MEKVYFFNLCYCFPFEIDCQRHSQSIIVSWTFLLVKTPGSCILLVCKLQYVHL
ncbi:Uncharacterized protein APZ42_022089 [Daphnia magna]|uniref:Uncharacterized protein n=1 Tax=Daphnia magna TaxID=35525 RepID=A0A164VZT4_9CRUS|nr:Uncharacterized protein APZ42_022089 [Daphnia magna]